MTTAIIGRGLDTGLNPEKADFDLDNYFAVRGRLWDAKEQDHSVEIEEDRGIKRFKDGGDALKYFDKATYGTFSEVDKGDMKIEFIHFRFTTPRVLKSRILFP
ncbi:MAG: hypothetical protein NPINA01_18670 [Nitrospinaceae bacterium]|nr:MAG: hypothetical protein NPINA01_18670 [Nitrospinaceae bacterium]